MDLPERRLDKEHDRLAFGRLGERVNE